MLVVQAQRIACLAWQSDLALVLLDEESRVRCKDVPSISIDRACIDLAWSGKSTSANRFGIVKNVSISRTK